MQLYCSEFKYNNKADILYYLTTMSEQPSIKVHLLVMGYSTLHYF